MVEARKTRISVIVGDSALEDFIVLVLIGDDYMVKVYKTQQEALKGLEQEPPDLIICDFSAQHINGLDICKILRKNLPYYYIPIIFILPEAEPLHKARLIYSGVDDYIMRTDVEDDLLVRVKLNLYRTGRQRDINPVTGLPGEASLLAELEKRLEAKKLFGVFHADLSDFRLFNQRYGFKRGDDVLKFTAKTIASALKDLGTPADFIAHPHSDDFVFLSSHDCVDSVCERIIQGFNVGVRSFYGDEDRAREYIITKNRKGEVLHILFLRIHIGVVTNEHYPFLDPIQVIQTSAELKDYSQKNFDKSMYVRERRKKYPFS